MWKGKERGEREVVVWADESPTRKFLYVEAAAEGIMTAAAHYDKADPINFARRGRSQFGTWRI